MDSLIPSGVMVLAGQMKGALLGVVFPGKCLVCGCFLHAESPGRKNIPGGNAGEILKSFSSPERAVHVLMAPHICPECIAGFQAICSPMCISCGMVFEEKSSEDHHCGHCLQSPKLYGKARALGHYQSACMELIHAYKYRGKIQLARPLGMLLFYAFLRYWSAGDIDCVIPVPLHQKRLKQRGFNQVYLLIRNWPSYLSCLYPDYQGKAQLRIIRNALIRTRCTVPQTGLGRQQRVSNVDGAFRIRDPAAIAGQSILLVDDVYTTGATVEACTKVLLKNGAANVDVVTLARAM